jgi:2-phospho-L-lactate/phosphoenolpyruvate guanylyltransferase
MSLCAIVPIKPLRLGKSRLSDILSEDKRIGLNKILLTSTLNCLSTIKEIQRIIVVSYDSEALMLSREFGAVTVLDPKNTNINRALRKATRVAKSLNFSKVLIVPTDLPFLNRDDIIRIINISKNTPEIVLAPDRRENGTNILYINPIGAIKYKFGDHSFMKHKDQAERKNVSIKVFRGENLSFDLDLPDDWNFLNSKNNKKKNHFIYNLLQEVGI